MADTHRIPTIDHHKHLALGYIKKLHAAGAVGSATLAAAHNALADAQDALALGFFDIADDLIEAGKLLLAIHASRRPVFSVN